MVAERQEAQKSYQRALRVIGRYLDSEPAYHVSVSEVADGFTVRSHSTQRGSDEVVKHFPWDRLDDLDKYYSGARGLGRRPSRYQAIDRNFPCGHEAALRKLGSILDEASASSLSIDEVPNGLDVSYMHPRQGRGTEKFQKVYAPDELC